MAEGQFDYTRHGQIDSYIHQWCEHRNENVVFEKDGEKKQQRDTCAYIRLESARIQYTELNFMRQSACLVFNPIMVDNYAAFFNCTPVGRASDSMTAPTLSYSF